MFTPRSAIAPLAFICAFGVQTEATHAKPPKLSSAGLGGVFANGACSASLISGTGRHVAFESIGNNLSAIDASTNRSVFQRDHETGDTKIASLKDDDSAISANSFLDGMSKSGRFVLFRAQELGIDPGSASANMQAYLRDTKLNTTRNVSLDSEGNAVGGEVTDCAMSPNARYVVFTTAAPFVIDGLSTTFAQVYLLDRNDGAVECVSFDTTGLAASANCSNPKVSANGRYVFFVTASAGLVTGDTNGASDIFVHDRDTATTSLVSKGDAGGILQGASAYEISASGKRVGFVSSGAVLDGFPVSFGLYIHDWKNGSIQAAFSSPSQHTITSVLDRGFGLSADGKRLAVATFDNLVPSQSGSIYDVYVVTLATAKVKLLTRDSDGGLTDDNSFFCAISGDGKFVSYTSQATDLVVPGAPINLDQVYRQKL